MNRHPEFYGRLRGVLDEAAAKLGESPLPFPKVYRCREGEKVILMEDLKLSGFRLNDAHDKSRKLALNEEEMGLTLRELARVHAGAQFNREKLAFSIILKNGLRFNFDSFKHANYSVC